MAEFGITLSNIASICAKEIITLFAGQTKFLRGRFFFFHIYVRCQIIVNEDKNYHIFGEKFAMTNRVDASFKSLADELSRLSDAQALAPTEQKIGIWPSSSRTFHRCISTT